MNRIKRQFVFLFLILFFVAGCGSVSNKETQSNLSSVGSVSPTLLKTKLPVSDSEGEDIIKDFYSFVDKQFGN